MALIKFISGDGVEHEVEETSPAAAHMVKEGFHRIDDDWHRERDNLPAEEPDVTYTDAEATAILAADDAATEKPADTQAAKSKKAARRSA
jgi:hypothetical protein